MAIDLNNIDWDALDAANKSDADNKNAPGDSVTDDRAYYRSLNPNNDSNFFMDTVRDIGRGAIGVADAVVGLADLGYSAVSGESFRPAAEKLGWKPRDWYEELQLHNSFERQRQDAEVSAADGLEAVSAYLSNPRALAGAVAQQLPNLALMATGGGAGARAGLAAAERAGLSGAEKLAYARGYASKYASGAEGALTTGSVAAAIGNEHAKNGRAATREEMAWAVPAGIATAAISQGMNRYGGSIEAAIGARMANAGFDNVVGKSAIGRGLKTMAGEGAEEALQSGQETAFTNIGTGKPVSEDVIRSMAEGGLLGGVTGGLLHPFTGSAKDSHNLIGGANPTASEEKAAKEGAQQAGAEIDEKVNNTLAAIKVAEARQLAESESYMARVQQQRDEEAARLNDPVGSSTAYKMATMYTPAIGGNAATANDVRQPVTRAQAIGMSPMLPSNPANNTYVPPEETLAQNSPKQTLKDVVLRHGMGKSLEIGEAIDDNGKLNQEFQRLSPAQQKFVEIFTQTSKDLGGDKFTPKALAKTITAAKNLVPYDATDDQLRQAVEGLTGTDERYEAMKTAMGPKGSIQTIDERMGNAPVETAPTQAISETVTKTEEAPKAETKVEAKAEEAPKPRRESMKREPLKRNADLGKDVDITKSMKDSADTEEFKVFSKAAEKETDASKKANPEDRMTASRVKNLITRAVRGDFKGMSYENAGDVADALIQNLSDRTLAAVHKWLGNHHYTAPAFTKHHGGGKLIHSRIGYHLAKKAPALLPENDNVVAEKKTDEVKAERKQARRERNPLEGIGVATKAEPVNYNKLAYEMPPVDANFDTALSLAKNKTEKHMLQRAKDTYDMLASGELRMFESKRDDSNFGQRDKDGVALPMIRISSAKDIEGYKLLGGGKLGKEEFAKIFSYLYWQDRKRLDASKRTEEADDTSSVRENVQYTRTDKDTLAEFGSVGEDGDFNLEGEIQDYTGGDTKLSKYDATAKKVSFALKDDSLDPEEAADAAIEAFDNWVDYVFNSSELKGTGSEPKGLFANFFTTDKAYRKVFFADGFLDALSDEDMAKKYGTDAKKYPINGVRVVKNKNGEVLRDQHGFERRAFVPPTAVSQERLMQWNHIAQELGKFIAKSGRPADARMIIKEKIWQHVKDNYLHYEPYTDETGDAALDDYHTELDNVRILVAERLALNFNLGISGALARGEQPTSKWLGKMVSNGPFSTLVKEGLADGVGEQADTAIASFKSLVDELFTSQQRKKLEDLSIESRVDFLETLASNPYLELRYDPSTGYKFVIDGTSDDGKVVTDFRPGDILLPQWVKASGLLSEDTIKKQAKDKRSHLGKIMLKAQRNYDGRAVGNAFGLGEAAMYQNMYSEISKDFEVAPHIVNAKQIAYDNLAAALHVAGAKARTDLAIAQVSDVVDTYARLQTQLSMLREEFHLIQRDEATRKLFAAREKDLEELISQCYQEMVVARNMGANLRASKEKLATRKDIFDKALNAYVKASQAYEGELARLRTDVELSSALEVSTLEKNLAIVAQAKKEALESQDFVKKVIGNTTGDDIYEKYAGADAPVTLITYDGQTVETNPGIAAQELVGNIFDALYVREGFQSRESAIGWAIAKTLPHIVGNTANSVKANELLKASAVMLNDAYEYESVAGNRLDDRVLMQKNALEGIFSNKQMKRFQEKYPTVGYDKSRFGLTANEVADIVAEINDVSKYLSSPLFRGAPNRDVISDKLRSNLQVYGTALNPVRHSGASKTSVDILSLPRLKFADLATKHPAAHAVIDRIRSLLVSRGRTSGYIGRIFGNFQFVMHPEGYGPDASVVLDEATGSVVIVLPDVNATNNRTLVSLAHEIAHVLFGDIRRNGAANSKAIEVTLDYSTGTVVPVGQAAKELMQLVEAYPLVGQLIGDYPLGNIAYTMENGEFAPEVQANPERFFKDPVGVQAELLAQIAVLWMFSPDAPAIITAEAPALAKILNDNICNGGSDNGGPTNTRAFKSNARETPSPEGALGKSDERRGNARSTDGANRERGEARLEEGERKLDARVSGDQDVGRGLGSSSQQGLEGKVKRAFEVHPKAKVEEAVSKLPPTWQNTAYKVVDFLDGILGDWFKNLRLGFTFTEDIANRFVKVLPALKGLMTTLKQKEAWQNGEQEMLARFRNRFDAFDKATQANINKFLEASTLNRVWAYRPDWVSDETWKNSMAHEKFAEIQAQFEALPQDAKNFVQDAFAQNHKMFSEKMDIMMEKTKQLFDDAIEGASDEQKAELIEQRKDAMARITKLRPDADWPYMPLVRRGSHAVTARSQELIDAQNELEELNQRRVSEHGLDPEDKARVTELRKQIEEMRADENHYIVSFVEGQGTANILKRELQGKHPGLIVEAFPRRVGTAHDAINFVAINALEDQLTVRMGESNSDGNRKLIRKMLTMLNDIYIENLADKHSRKAEMHRSNVAGYNPDMVANFLDQGYREINYLAGVKYNKEVRDNMRNLQSQAQQVGGDVPREERMRIYNEILKRQELDYEHKPNSLIDATQRVTSLSMLLLSPAYYLQNATQPFMMSAPYMAGKHDATKVFANLASDMKSIATAYFDKKNRDGVAPKFEEIFKGNEPLLRALAHARKQGRIDIGMAQDFGHLQNASTFQRVTDKISNAARLTEMLNRVATFKTAFELEYAKTGNEVKALEYADEVLYETHGNYSNNNAPRFFKQGGLGLGGAEKLIFQFRKFQLIQLGMMSRLVKDSLIGETSDARKTARYALAYTMGTHLALTGMKGAPFVMFLLAAMGLGDEDDNEEDVIRKVIGDKGMADLVLGGIPAALGLDVSGRIGAGTMLSPFPYLSSKPWDNQEAANEFWVAMAGPAVAQANRMFDAMALMGEGEYFKGIEKAIPNGLGNAMRAYRLSTEGYTTRNGTITIPSSEFDAMDTFFQAIGLPTNVTTDRMRLQDKVIRSEEYFAKEERLLNKAYRNATTQKERMEIQREYIALQKKRAEKGFTPKPVTQLVKNAAKVEKDAKNAVGGVVTTNTNRAFVDFWSKL